MKKYILIYILGILTSITVFHVWYLYRLNSRLNILEAFATQVTQIINQSAQASQVKK